MKHFVLTLCALTWASMGCSPLPPPATPKRTQPATEALETPPVFALASEVNGEVDPHAVTSRITKVTVYSDRALVTREATVTLAAEPTLHRFRQLPGWVDEGSIRAATSAGKILDVSIEREFLARSTDAGFRKAEEAHADLLRRMQALDDELAILEAQRAHVGSIQVFSVEKLETDAITRDVNVKQYGEVVDFVTDKLRDTAAARRTVEAKREDLAPKVEASSLKLEELRRLTTLEQTTVSVTIEGKGAAQASVELTYATPGATWEPAHELRMRSDHPESVALTSFAVVTQTTGEDWRHAELTFSTQSSSDAEQIPELEMLALGKPAETTRSVTRTTTFSKAQQKYEEQNRHWNQLNQVSSKRQADISQFEKTYSSNLAYFEQVQTRTIELFQGLSTRGTTAHFTAREPGLVRSDGVPVRLPIGGSSLGANERIIAAPERSLNAAVTLEMTNGGQSLLPGRVSRYFDGAFLGVTDTEFVAPGEDFSLFFRVADQIKLTRKLDRKHSSLSRNARNRMQLAFVSSVENLSKRPVTLVVAERVPVSENSEIRVSQVRISPKQEVNAEGIARWTLTLEPGERRELRVSYQVDYPPSLVIDVKRKRELRKQRGPSPPRPSPASRPDFEDQIIQYEQMF